MICVLKRILVEVKKISVFLFVFSFLLGFNFLAGLFGIKYIQKHQIIISEFFNNTQRVLSKNNNLFVLGESTELVYRDARVASLTNFFSRYNSPLEPYAEKIVNISDSYGFHYGLLPAIAMVESNLCKKAPADSFNCWGWGIYGKTVTRFSSYDEAIETVARGLKRDYLDKGYDTLEEIMSKYNPSNHNNWLGAVTYFLGTLD